MSTLSLINQDRKTLIDLSDKALTKLSTKYLFKRRFDIGKGVDMFDYMLIQRFKSILCEKECFLDKEELDKLKEKLNIINYKYV